MFASEVGCIKGLLLLFYPEVAVRACENSNFIQDVVRLKIRDFSCEPHCHVVPSGSRHLPLHRTNRCCASTKRPKNMVGALAAFCATSP